MKMIVQVRRCPSCGEDQHVDFFTQVPVDRPETTTRLCTNCGLVFASPRPGNDDLRGFYETEYRKMTNKAEEEPKPNNLKEEMLRAMKMLSLIERYQDKVTRHLDIGSSTGVLMAAVQDRSGCQSVGVEPNIGFNEYVKKSFAKGREDAAKEETPDELPPNTGLVNLYSSMESLKESEEEPFDLITMIHTIEHVSDPWNFINETKGWLSDNGILVIEVPHLFGGHVSAMMYPHLTAWTVDSLKYIVNMVGLYVIDIETFSFGAPYFPAPRDITLIATLQPQGPTLDNMLNRYLRYQKSTNRIAQLAEENKGYAVG